MRLGWGPAQSTIWILRSCQTTTHTHTHNPVCVPDHPRSQRPAGPEVMSSRCGCTDNTHTPLTDSHRKMHINTHICHLKKRTASYLNHTITPTRHRHTHILALPHSSARYSVNERDIMSMKETWRKKKL